MKTCKDCGRTGAADEFHWNTCVPCYNDRYRLRYHETRIEDFGAWAHELSLSMITQPLRATPC